MSQLNMDTDLSLRAQSISNILQQILEDFEFDPHQEESHEKKQAEAGEYVSSLDLNINKFITDAIAEKFPKDTIISEEGEEFQHENSFWLIDPLDGTNNFLGGSAIFGITITFCSQEDVIAAGLLFPCFRDIWIAEKGRGVFRNDNKFTPKPTSTKKFLFAESAVRRMGTSLLEASRELGKRGYGIRILGASCYEHILLAQSRGCLLRKDAHLWDVAPGALLIKEVGGEIFDFEENPWTFESDSFISLIGLSEQEKREVLRKLQSR